jgi:hypothetical protein
LPNESRPLGPRALIMPDVQGKDFQRHASNLAAITGAYRFSRKKSAIRRTRDISTSHPDLAARLAMI